LRGVPATDNAIGLDAALVSLSGRVRLREGVTRSTEDIVQEIWAAVFAASPDDGGDPGKE
jgi:MoxR-like ATPase